MANKHELSNSVLNEIQKIKEKSKIKPVVIIPQEAKRVKIIECPRDAMQGIKPFIKTAKKAAYINTLLKVGFDTIDFGSFVSEKAIPQLKDTVEVIKLLDMDNTNTTLLSIVGNLRGGKAAAAFDEISFIGFPFSISPTFLKRNLNSTIDESIKTIQGLMNLCEKNNKTLVVYISMGFGNPYGDEWNVDIMAKWTKVLVEMGVSVIQLSDTIGKSNVQSISSLFANLVPAFGHVEFGFHLHTSIRHWYRKVNAAYENGCRRFDTVINGLGGCPMAEEGQLVGNLKTSNLLEYLETKSVQTNIDEEAFLKAYMKALKTFPSASIFQTGQ